MTMKSLSKLFTTASLLLFLESTYNKIWKEKKHPLFKFYHLYSTGTLPGSSYLTRALIGLVCIWDLLLSEGATTVLAGLKHIVLAYAGNSGSLQQIIFIYASVCI